MTQYKKFGGKFKTIYYGNKISYCVVTYQYPQEQFRASNCSHPSPRGPEGTFKATVTVAIFLPQKTPFASHPSLCF